METAKGRGKGGKRKEKLKRERERGACKMAAWLLSRLILSKMGTK